MPRHAPPPHDRRTVPSDRYQGQFAAAKMGALGLKKVVVAFSDESYGETFSLQARPQGHHTRGAPR
jgi:ABC-type branched-subunit amino acid transport system substrate-binding protein